MKFGDEGGIGRWEGVRKRIKPQGVRNLREIHHVCVGGREVLK